MFVILIFITMRKYNFFNHIHKNFKKWRENVLNETKKINTLIFSIKKLAFFCAQGLIKSSLLREGLKRFTPQRERKTKLVIENYKFVFPIRGTRGVIAESPTAISRHAQNIHLILYCMAILLQMP